MPSGFPGQAGRGALVVPSADAPTIPGYTLVFHDDFNSGSAPNYGNGAGGAGTYWPTPTWGSGDLWAPGQANDMKEDADLLQGNSTTSGRAGFSSTLATISGGALHLNAVNSSQRYGGQTYPHGSSMIRTRESWLCGIFEARISVPSGKGCWPALWLMPAEYNDNALWEIDVFEFLNSEPSTKARLNCHWGSGYGGPGHFQSQTEVSGNWTGFHTYQMIWTPTSYVWKFDGSTVKTFTDGVNGDVNPDVPMQLIASLSMGGDGDWPGETDGTTPWPIDMPIDYVRVWQAS